MKSRILILLLSVVMSISSFGQNHKVYGLFPTYTADLKLNEKWIGSVYSFLSVNPSEQTTEGVVYPAKSNAFYIELDASYNWNKEWSITGSYTYERANPFRKDYRNENRVWLQGQYCKKFKKINLKNRLRYDFRFIQNRVTTETDFNPRLRYLLGIDFPLNDKSLYLAVYNEFFFDTYKNKIALYSENWAFAGVGFNVSEKTKVETGLLNISWIRNSDKDWLHQYYWQFTIIQKFI